MMTEFLGADPVSSLRRAATLIRHAVELLDQAAAPADIGAYLDHAASRLDDIVLGDCTRESAVTGTARAQN